MQIQKFKLRNSSTFIVLLIVAIIYRYLLAYGIFGGGDATNIQSFILVERASISVYELESPWPYLPMTVGLLHAAGYFSETILIDAQHHYRSLLSLFDLCIALLIYYHSQQNNENNLLNIIHFSVYAFSPVASLITSILGFLDAASLLIMFIIATRISNDQHQNRTTEIKVNSFLVAIATSFKPMGIILLPYLMFQSRRPFFVLLYFALFVHLCNFNYILEKGFFDFYKLLNYIFVKMTVGHQLSGIGLGAFETYIPFTILKLITILGLLFAAILILYALRKDPFTYIMIAFLSLLAFRYNTHPQYLLWPIPFLIVARSINASLLFSIIAAITIIISLPSWHSNSGAYIILESLGFGTNGVVDSLLKIKYDESLLQHSLQILLIMTIIFSIGTDVIKKAFLQFFVYILNTIKSINFRILIAYSGIYLPTIILNRSYIVNEDLLFSLRYTALCIVPVIMLILVFAIRLRTPSLKLYQGLFMIFIAQQILISELKFDTDFLRWTGVLFFIVILIELKRITDYLGPFEEEKE